MTWDEETPPLTWCSGFEAASLATAAPALALALAEAAVGESGLSVEGMLEVCVKASGGVGVDGESPLGLAAVAISAAADMEAVPELRQRAAAARYDAITRAWRAASDECSDGAGGFGRLAGRLVWVGSSRAQERVERVVDAMEARKNDGLTRLRPASERLQRTYTLG